MMSEKYTFMEISYMLALHRRDFLQTAGTAVAGGLTTAPSVASAQADVKPLKFRLGIVTYNVAAQWDRPTILKICKNVGLSPVELRTMHKHGVEPSLSADQRKEVKKEFTDAGI